MTMTEPASEPAAVPSDVLDRLGRLCAERGLDALAANLSILRTAVIEDLGRLEAELTGLAESERAAHRAARRLVLSGGKRLRPLCVALAARAGSGFDRRALDLAVAVELVHNATLLHDDVIDLASTRRGAPAARVELGNAASIFAGDWLLIEALRRVQRSGVDLLEPLLDTIAEMIHGESLQLENRGCLDSSVDLYFEIAECKSAALFRWGMLAGAAAGGLGVRQREALAEYGTHLGIAFQIIDDLLDLTGDREKTGKALFADLREGKMTLPLILGLEADPGLRPRLEEAMALSFEEHRPWRRSAASSWPASASRVEPVDPPPPLSAALHASIANTLIETGADERCRELARERVLRAHAALAPLPASEAKNALLVIAESTVRRDL